MSIFVSLLMGLIVTSGVPQAAEPYFATIGEGMTGLDEQGRMPVAWRMFSAPDPICDGLPRPAEFLARVSDVQLVVGRPFHLSDLAVDAFDRNGVPIDHLPFTVEVQETSPPMLDLLDYQTTGGGVVPLRAGEILFRIRTICSEPLQSVVIRAVAGPGERNEP